jgi:hypothetical protein
MSNSVFGKFNYEGDYLSGYSVDSNCGDVKLSQLSYSEYKAKDYYMGTVQNASNVLFTDKCKFGLEANGIDDPNCEKMRTDLKNLELQYMTKILQKNIIHVRIIKSKITMVRTLSIFIKM